MARDGRRRALDGSCLHDSAAVAGDLGRPLCVWPGERSSPGFTSECSRSVTNTDWSEWPDAYAREDSGLADRLEAVRAAINRRLDQTAPDPVQVISACAGDGRYLLGALAAADVLDARVEVHQADAAQSSVYKDAAPADPVLLCGIFGNISDNGVRVTIEAAPQLCGSRAQLIWTRHRGDPDLTPSVREWFAAAASTRLPSSHRRATSGPHSGRWACTGSPRSHVAAPIFVSA